MEEVYEFISLLPKADIYGYGSGFFKQESGKKELDLLIFTDGINTWHQNNYKLNPTFYEGSNVKELLNGNNSKEFPKSVSCFFVNYKDHTYKLMVIDRDYLKKDISSWEDFSIPARLQKPTICLEKEEDLTDLLEKNYDSALLTSLFLLKGIIKEEDIYKKIVSLSYIGDIRVRFGFENKNKINNIVNGSYDFFKEIYGSKLNYFADTVTNHISKSDINLLPKNLRDFIMENDPKDLDEVSSLILNYFKYIDFVSSKKLALRCLETVGPKMSLNTFTRKAKLGKKIIKTRK